MPEVILLALGAVNTAASTNGTRPRILDVFGKDSQPNVYPGELDCAHQAPLRRPSRKTPGALLFVNTPEPSTLGDPSLLWMVRYGDQG